MDTTTDSPLFIGTLVASFLIIFIIPLWVAHIAKKKGHKEWAPIIYIFSLFGLGILPSLFALLAIKTSDKVAIGIGVLCFAIPLLAAGIQLTQATIRFNQIDDAVAEYVATASLTEMNPNPYIVGRYIILPQGTASEVSWYEIYPDGYSHGVGAFSSFESISTILVVDCQEEAVRSYSHGARGYQATCIMTIIDKTKNSIVDRQSFTGAYPPSSFTCNISSGGCDFHGKYPFDEMTIYIEKLPRK